jgi:hypothetical protein
VGTFTNTFIIFYDPGKITFCSFTITVKDTEPPVLAQLNADPVILSPANHKMRDIMISYTATDNCGAVTSSLSVSSNEPINSTGDGNTSPDWIIKDDHHLQLRAERAGTGRDRIYTITISCKDAAGNKTTKSLPIVVPHDLGMVSAKETISPVAAISDRSDLEDVKNQWLASARVVPNPSSHFFTLQMETTGNELVEVRLFDITGKLVSVLYKGKNNTVRFGDHLRPGVYIVDIGRQNKQHQKIKVIKQ